MKTALALFALLALPGIAAEPEKPARSADDLQPAVNTSAAPAAAPSAATGAATSPASQNVPGTSAARAAPANASRSGARDRIELDTTQITGNRELPRVLYVVPWKRSDLGDLAGRPANSLLDEVLAPVDRDVFKRQNHYYEALKPDAAPARTGGGSEGEK